MSLVTIYGLAEPDSGYCRYVGKSKNPRKRFHAHFWAGTKSHRSSWIKSLRSRGLRPEMFVLEQVDESDWEEAERFWISYLRMLGCKLVNQTGGGDGVSQISEETRRRFREVKKGTRASLETRLKMSAANKGRKLPPRERGPSPLKGRKIPATQRLRIIAALTGRKVSEATRAKLRLSNLGKHPSKKGIPRSEKVREAMRLAWRRKTQKSEQLDLFAARSSIRQEELLKG